VLYTCTDHNLVYRSDGSLWTTFITLATGLSNPMTTAEDIIVGGASGTPARLAVGTEGQVLSVSSGAVAWAAAASGGIDSGSSFPGLPTTNDLFYHTTHGMLFFYNGTLWLTVQKFFTQWAITTALSAATAPRAPLDPDLQVYVLDLVARVYVTTTNNGSNYWTVDFIPVGTTGSSIGSCSTSASSPNVYLDLRTAKNAVVAATDTQMIIDFAKTGSPGTLLGGAGFTYRLTAS